MITNIFRILLARSLKPLMFTNEKDYVLELDSDEAGIYVHIPFCTSLCPFCPYNRIKYDERLIKPYKEALIKEINKAGKMYNEKKKITSIYFGGGSPALMLDDLGDIITALKDNFIIHSSIGIELHPRDITPESLAKLKRIGFDMVSIGIQSFDKQCLSTLGRQYIDGAEKVKQAREAGFKTIDVDLIFGIHNQSDKDLENDFLTAFDSGATQVSTYPFIDFSYADNKNKPIGKREKKRLLEALERISSRSQCVRTAVWTFGREGTQKYSSVTRDIYIGFGASAASLTGKLFKINTFSVEEYIKCLDNDDAATALTMRFSKRTRALYWLFWNAYTLRLDNTSFHNLFSVSLENMFGVELKLGMLLGIIKKANKDYELTEKGAYLYHLIEQKYTNQYIDKTWRIARQAPWPEKIKLY